MHSQETFVENFIYMLLLVTKESFEAFLTVFNPHKVSVFQLHIFPQPYNSTYNSIILILIWKFYNHLQRSAGHLILIKMTMNSQQHCNLHAANQIILMLLFPYDLDATFIQNLKSCCMKCFRKDQNTALIHKTFKIPITIVKSQRN